MPKLAMNTTEGKKLLTMSKRRLVYCAIASGYDDASGFALFRLDRTKKPRKLADELSEEFDKARNIRFGVVSIDGKTVKVELNRPARGLTKKLLRALRGTGFTKADISSSRAAAQGKSEGKGSKEPKEGQDGADESNAFEMLLKQFGLDNDSALRKQKGFFEGLLKKEDERRDRKNINKVRETLETVQKFGWEALKLKETYASTLTGAIRNVLRLPANSNNTISDDGMRAIVSGLAAFLTAVQVAQEKPPGNH
jgi:hypothetical protein